MPLRREAAAGGSNTATIASVTTVPQKELRNKVGEVLRRAEAGEEITITVSGRPVARLGPARTREWVDDAVLAELAALPPDPTFMEDIEAFEGELVDPWADRE
jgi:prevent-host-death family protein